MPDAAKYSSSEVCNEWRVFCKSLLKLFNKSIKKCAQQKSSFNNFYATYSSNCLLTLPGRIVFSLAMDKQIINLLLIIRDSLIFFCFRLSNKLTWCLLMIISSGCLSILNRKWWSCFNLLLLLIERKLVILVR